MRKKKEVGVTAVNSSPKNGILTVEVNKDVFMQECEYLLNISPVYNEAKKLSKFSFYDMHNYWVKIKDVVELVISSIEVSKSNILSSYPEGTKFSRTIALETAVGILDKTITFSGVVGRLLDAVDGPLLKLLVNIVLGDRSGVNWLADAFAILGVVKTSENK